MVQSTMTGLIFAKTAEESTALLRTHPIYQEDIKKTIEDDEDNNAEILMMDPVKYIFDDVGCHLAQLNGDFVEVPAQYVEIIRAALSTKPGAD